MDCIILNNSSQNPFIAVKKMVLEHYSHLENTLVVLGYNERCNIRELRDKHPNKKIIIYQLEQLYGYKSKWYNPYSKEDWIIKRTNNIHQVGHRRS